MSSRSSWRLRVQCIIYTKRCLHVLVDQSHGSAEKVAVGNAHEVMCRNLLCRSEGNYVVMSRLREGYGAEKIVLPCKILTAMCSCPLVQNCHGLMFLHILSMPVGSKQL